MLNTDEFINIVNQYGTEHQKSLLGNYRTNWNDEIYQTAFGTDNNLSVSGLALPWLPFRVSTGIVLRQVPECRPECSHNW